jgi:D-amino-acid oxidase
VDGIVERCRALLQLDGHPNWNRLSAAHATRRLVALRPARLGDSSFDHLRLEPEIVSGRRVIHHYGHGRQGISISWGTAREVADILSRG